MLPGTVTSIFLQKCNVIAHRVGCGTIDDNDFKPENKVNSMIDSEVIANSIKADRANP
jgi:hypothetical protein